MSWRKPRDTSAANYPLELTHMAPGGYFHVLLRDSDYHDRKVRAILAGGEIGPLVELRPGHWLGQLVDGRHICIATYPHVLRIGLGDSAVAAAMATNPRGDAAAVALCPWPPRPHLLTLDQALNLAEEAGLSLHYYYRDPAGRWAAILPIMRGAAAVGIGLAGDLQPCDSCGRWAAGVASFYGGSAMLLMSVPLCEQHLAEIPNGPRP